MIVEFLFAEGVAIDIDVQEFGEDGMGGLLDQMAACHGGVQSAKLKPYPPGYIPPRERMPATQMVQLELAPLGGD
jgi:hypothetical protein